MTEQDKAARRWARKLQRLLDTMPHEDYFLLESGDGLSLCRKIDGAIPENLHDGGATEQELDVFSFHVPVGLITAVSA